MRENLCRTFLYKDVEMFYFMCGIDDAQVAQYGGKCDGLRQWTVRDGRHNQRHRGQRLESVWKSW